MSDHRQDTFDGRRCRLFAQFCNETNARRHIGMSFAAPATSLDSLLTAVDFQLNILFGCFLVDRIFEYRNSRNIVRVECRLVLPNRDKQFERHTTFEHDRMLSLCVLVIRTRTSHCRPTCTRIPIACEETRSCMSNDFLLRPAAVREHRTNRIVSTSAFQRS
jgi:hypothetical protein